MDTTELTIEGNMIDKSCTSNGGEEASERSTFKALESHPLTSKQESFISRDSDNVESLSADARKSDEPNKNEHVQNSSSVDECEHVDVENFTLTDDSIDVVNSPKKTDERETLALDIKDSYVKLDRTRLAEKIIDDKQQQLKENNDLSVKITTNVDGGTGQNDVITNAKTAIVLVNDFVKSNEYFNKMKDEKIFDSGISLNNREEVNDDELSIVTVEDNDEVLSLKLSSPNSHRGTRGEEADGEKLIIEALPDDEMGNDDKSVGAREKNIEKACVDEIGDERGLISENTGNASKATNEILQQNDSIANADLPAGSANVKLPLIEVDLVGNEEEEAGGNFGKNAIASNDVEAEKLVSEQQQQQQQQQLEPMELSSTMTESKENIEIANSCNETNSNVIQSKSEDNNGVPCAVTDADGENASWPPNDDGDDDDDDESQHETSADTTSSKSAAKKRGGGGGGKRKSESRSSDSDLDESAENLFQDIPAEEWQSEAASERMESSGIKNARDASTKLDGSVDQTRKSINTLNGKDCGGKVVGACETENQQANSPKKARKSRENIPESGPNSSFGIQNKTVVDGDSSADDNELPNKSRNRRSLDGSVKGKNYTTAEKLSKSLVADVPPSPLKSGNKSRKSLNNSMQFNVSVFNKFRKKNDVESELAEAAAASSDERNNPLADERRDENSEAMQVDEESDSQSETNRAHDSQRRCKSQNKSLVDQSSSNAAAAAAADSIAEDTPVALNASSQVAKRLSLDKSLNKSRRKSLAAEQAADFNKSKQQLDSDDESPLNELSGKNDGLSSSAGRVNELGKSRRRLSEKIDVSTRELPENEEMDVDVDTAAADDDEFPKKSRNGRSLDNSSKSSLNESGQASPKSGSRKSANKSSNVSTDVGNVEKVESASTSKSPPKVSLNESAAGAERGRNCRREEEEETVPSGLDRSLQKSIHRMKFSNPPKHDVSTVVQVNSSSEDDSDDIPNFIFKLSDEEEEEEEEAAAETEDSSEENAENDVDSDVEREYNLGGKDIAEYSDDDVAGDDCRVSEEESSDNEDDGADLGDFVVPDEDEDEDEDEDNSNEDEDEGEDKSDEDEDENEGEDNSDEDENNSQEDDDVEIEGPSTKKVSALKRNSSISSSQSTVKNSLRRSGFSQSSGSESDDEATEVENRMSNFDMIADSEKFLKDSKKLEQQGIMLSNMIKVQNASLQRKSLDKSCAKSNAPFNSSAASGNAAEDQSRVKEKSLIVSSKNASLSTSKSEDKSISKSINGKNTTADSGKNVLAVENGQSESSSSDSDDDEEMATAATTSSEASEGSEGENIASEEEETSEEEEGEDYYRIVESSTRDASIVKPKNKKLIDCSTPKPGAKKPADMSKDNLSISVAAAAAAASRRKSGSLDDLSSTKMMSSRLSIGEAAAATSKSMKLGDVSMKLKQDVEIVATPETLARPRQAWKLIPLNQTAHPSVEDTPGTKFLKKAKLNESVPAELESAKRSSSSSSSSSSSGGKKSKKAALEQEAKISKKRKLLDVSQALDEDSVLKVAKKNKKRARLDASLVSAGNEEEVQDEQSSSENRQRSGQEDAVSGKSRKKKRNRGKECEQEQEEEAAAQAAEEEEPSKKRKDKSPRVRLTAAAGQRDAASNEKRSKVSGGESAQRSTKRRQKQASDSDGEAPEGLEVVRRRALKEMQQRAEGGRGGTAARERLSGKAGRKDPAEKAAAKSLKRLPEDILEDLTDERAWQRPDKRQKLSRNRERSVMMPSKSMFSPGKSTPENLRVDEGYVPLSSAGGTTQFAVVNLQQQHNKARKVTKRNAAVLNFRSKMLARNKRMPTSMYLDYLKKQKAKGNQ